MREIRVILRTTLRNDTNHFATNKADEEPLRPIGVCARYGMVALHIGGVEYCVNRAELQEAIAKGIIQERDAEAFAAENKNQEA